MGGPAAHPTEFLSTPLRLCARMGPFFFVLSFVPLASTPLGAGVRFVVKKGEIAALHCKGAISCFLSKHFQATSFATSASRSFRAAVMICWPLGVTR
jgi:hypothetical protein